MRKIYSTIAIIVILVVYMVLVWEAFLYLENHKVVDPSDKMKISDYVGAAVAIAATLTGCIAAVFSYHSLRFAQKAEEGKLYLTIMERYSSPEMANALRLLGTFRAENKDNLEQALRDWKFNRDNNDAEAIKIENARHKVKYFYRDLMQLYQAGYFNKKLTKRLLNTGGRILFKEVVLGMEEHSNRLQFEKEFDPFDRLYDELGVEQVRNFPEHRPLKKVCLIPARLDASRFDRKLLMLLGTDKTGRKTVIRVTYERICSHKLFDMVAVVTNDLEIKEEIERHGGTVLYFNSGHNSGTDRIAEAAKSIDADIIVNVQGDEPFVEKKPLEDLLAIIDPHRNPKIVGSLMRRMHDQAQINSSDFVKVVCDKKDQALYFGRSITPFKKNAPPKAPEAEYFEHIGVYAFTRPALLDFAKLEATPLELIESVECLRFLENGIPIKMVKTDYHALEIDTQPDLDEANRKIEAGEFSINFPIEN